MPFFEPPEPPDDKRKYWEFDDFGSPSDELPGLVPYPFALAATNAGALGVSAIAAYSRGFTVTLQAVAARRPGQRRLHDALHWFGAGELPDDLIRFGIEFADGTKLTNIDALAFDESAETSPEAGIVLGDSSAGDRDWQTEFWVWPLPPEGPLAFVCEWPAMGIPETRQEVDARLILDAAERARPLWP